MRELSRIGYDTGLYSPINFRGEPDSEMYRALGFKRQVYPKATQTVLALAFGNSGLELLAGLDADALALMKNDMERSIARGLPFAYVFAPEVSHGPWPESIRGAEIPDIKKRGRRLFEIVDQYLGQILELLDGQHQLRRTIIVVVGDHGVRDQEEDPELPTGVMDDYSFHVPLLIYAPQTLKGPQEISWLTSHIDVAPTVLDLLGVQRDRNWEQGTPIWNPVLARRSTFFPARIFIGTDGYYSNGMFLMWNHLSDTVYANDRMRFDPRNIVRHGSPLYVQGTTVLSRFIGLQEVWVTRFSQADSLRNHLYGSNGAY
jgi:membrane-anchored protein YejM (alkaline phosphatase superfamily)